MVFDHTLTLGRLVRACGLCVVAVFVGCASPEAAEPTEPPVTEADTMACRTALRLVTRARRMRDIAVSEVAESLSEERVRRWPSDWVYALCWVVRELKGAATDVLVDRTSVTAIHPRVWEAYLTLGDARLPALKYGCHRLIYSETLDELAEGRTHLRTIEALEEEAIEGCEQVIAMAERQAAAAESD